MQTKNEKNRYLFENHLDNQFATFDLIITRKLPAESELKLYDIVVYEKDGLLLVHRIVGIEEPNEKHPDERYFLLQGDAVSTPDVFPVKYSQMRGIYRNERIPFLGSFVWFMQSPAGYLCILLVVFAIICSPLMDKKVEKARAERLAILLAQLQSKAAYEQVQKARTTKQSPYGVPAPIPVKGTIAGYIKLLPVPPDMQAVDLAELEKQYK